MYVDTHHTLKESFKLKCEGNIKHGTLWVTKLKIYADFEGVD